MSYPLYPQIDPQEVQQAHQYNVVCENNNKYSLIKMHQPPPQYQHNFVNPSSTTPSYQTENNFYPPQTFVPPHQFVYSNVNTSNQPHQSNQQYYYQPQQVNAHPPTQHAPQYVYQNVPPSQTSYPNLYAPQQNTYQTQSNPVQTPIPSQPIPPVTHTHNVHPIATQIHQQQPQLPAQPAEQLSDEEKEDDEMETTSSIITTDRKLARLLNRIEKTLKRLQISIMKRNRSGTSRSKELLEANIIELQSYHIADAEERASVNLLIQRIQMSLKHAEEELQLMEQDRQRNLAQYRNAVMELKKEAQQAQQLLESDLDQQTKDIIHQVQQQQHQS